jgi:hypothetical protein
MADDNKAPTGTKPPATANKPAQGKAKTPAKSKLILVRSLLPAAADGGDPVVLSEQDPRHPGGQAFIAGKTHVKVYPTPAVVALIKGDKLKDVTDGEDEEEEVEADTEE